MGYPGTPRKHPFFSNSMDYKILKTYMTVFKQIYFWRQIKGISMGDKNGNFRKAVISVYQQTKNVFYKVLK